MTEPRKGPQGFIVVLPGEIIEIPQDDDKSWLTLFYTLPKELVENFSAALEIPRCPYEVLRTNKYDHIVKDDMMKVLVWDRQFLLEHFVSRGMVVDFAIHDPDTEPGGISNPHFHVMAPIRPIEENGKWGMKQRRVYVLDEDGNRLLDADGNYVFNVVPTTDWDSPETLEYWREQWAALCNAKFEEKGIGERIDHRSYERQGIDLLPTIHEGPAVRQMEAKGIRTDKGEFNRWIKTTNSVIREIKNKIAALLDWLKEVKAELSKPKAPNLLMLLQRYFDQRNAGAYSKRAKVNNLKEYSELCQYLLDHDIHDLETLEACITDLRTTTDRLKMELDTQTAEMKMLRKIPEYYETYKQLKPVFDGLQKIKYTKAREKYKAEHAHDLKRFYEARRIISQKFPDGKYNSRFLDEEYGKLEQEHDTTYAQFKAIREDSQMLWKIKSHIDTVRKNLDRSLEHDRIKTQDQTIE